MDHAKSFDSLLSLMPADVYFGKDNSVCPFLGGIVATPPLHNSMGVLSMDVFTDTDFILLRTNGRGRNRRRRSGRLRRGPSWILTMRRLPRMSSTSRRRMRGRGSGKRRGKEIFPVQKKTPKGKLLRNLHQASERTTSRERRQRGKRVMRVKH